LETANIYDNGAIEMNPCPTETRKAFLAGAMDKHAYSKAMHHHHSLLFDYADQRMMTVNYRTTTPAILAVFEKSSSDQPAATWNPGLTTPSGSERYIAKSAEADRQIHAALLADEQTPVMVWGTGAHTLRLLETSQLGEARITAFIDSNARYHDEHLRGAPILAPEAVRRQFNRTPLRSAKRSELPRWLGSWSLRQARPAGRLQDSPRQYDRGFLSGGSAPKRPVVLP
jgi:hypothetical protein